MEFHKRFVQFYFNCIKSDNDLVNYVFRSALTNDSRLGSNIRFILHKFNVNVNNVFHDEDNIQSDLLKQIVNEYINMQNEPDIRVGEQILELIKHRDSLDIWLLNKKEIREVIDMLSTG